MRRFFQNMPDPSDEVTPTERTNARRPIENIDEALLSMHFDIQQFRAIVDDLKPFLIAVKWVPIMIAGLLFSAFMNNVVQVIVLLRR